MSDQRTSRISRFLAAVLLLVGLFACSTGREGGGSLNLVDAQGKHPAGFINTHPGLALSAINQCKT
ncbi:MAG: hypothetical protein WAT51_12985, partial [Holophaga sp.]